MQNKTHKKGMLMALIPAFLGVVLWYIVWKLGSIPAFVSFAVVYGMYWFYGKWGGRISKKELTQLMLLAAIFILLAFLVSFVADVWEFYVHMDGGAGGIFSEDFRKVVFDQLAHVDGYIKDLGLTILFTVFAIVSLVYDKKRRGEEKKIDEIAKTL